MVRSHKKSSAKSRKKLSQKKTLPAAVKGAKTVTFQHRLMLPVEQVYEVLTSERYLLTLEGMDQAAAETSRIVSARTETFDSGTVQAVVVVHPVPAEPEQGWESEEVRRRAEADAARDEVAQVTRVTALRDGGFTMTSVLPLANGLGEVLSSFEFSGADDADSVVGAESGEVTVTEVVASLTISVKVSAVRVQFEQAFLAGAEDSVLKGLRRIETLS